MTVKLLTPQTSRKYTGLSSDTKPTLGFKDLGAKFFETDSKFIYKWLGTSWHIIAIGGSNITGDFYLELSKGNIPGHSGINKFGHHHSVGTTQEVIWPLGGIMEYSTIADITGISSTNDLDTQNVIIQGLDSNWLEVDVPVTLNGQTEVVLGTSLIRINRVYNDDNTDFAGNIYVYTSAATVTAGIPSPISTARAYVEGNDNITLQCIYTVPANKTGYLVFGKASVSSGKDVVLKFYGRAFGKVFTTRHVIDVYSNTYDYFFKLPLSISEKSDIELRAKSSASGTEVSAAFDIVLVDM